MNADHRYSFLGLVCPVDSSIACPYEYAVGWWEARKRVGAAIRKHASMIEQAIARNSYFFDGFTDSTDEVVHAVRTLDVEWTRLHAQICPTDQTKRMLKLPDKQSLLFKWSFCGPSFVTLKGDGSLLDFSVSSHGVMASPITVFETVALKLLRLALSLQLSARYSICGEMRSALAMAYSSNSAARVIITSLLPDLADRAAQANYHETPPEIAEKRFWRHWFAALLMSHAKYCYSVRTVQMSSRAAEFDSMHLLSLMTGDERYAILSKPHAANIALYAEVGKKQLLVEVGLALGDRAIEESKCTKSLQVASSLLHWFGNRNEIVDKKRTYDSAYIELTNDLPSLMFNHDTRIERLHVVTEQTPPAYGKSVLIVPNIVVE